MTEDQDRQRFQQVVLPHLDDALSLARWLTGSVSDGEDVVQDACLRAFAAIGSAGDANPRAWLMTIVRNTAFTWLAKNRPKTLIVTDDDSEFEEARREVTGRVDGQTPESLLLAKADFEMLHGAIASLPLPFREVIVLREIEGFGYREIAQIAAIPVGTVMSRLARARSLLIQRIGTMHSGQEGAA